MRRFRALDLLSLLGLAVIVGSQAWLRAGRTLPGEPRYYVAGGVFLIVLHITLRWEDIAGRVGRRQLRYGSNAFVMMVAVLAILGLVNYFVARYTKRWDLTKGQRYSLSDQTRKVLEGLKEPVKITYFQRGSAAGPGQDRLKEYQALTDKVTVEYVDPVAKPVKAQEYEARGPWPMLVVERGQTRERITNDSEQDVTNAIIKVTRGAKKTVCFAEGEGERDPDASGEAGYSNAKAALGKTQYEVQKVVLLRERKVPEPCTVLVVAGPQKDLLPEAIDPIRAFVKQGGKALILVEPPLEGPQPNLTGLLAEWNLQAGQDVVVDVSGMGQLFGTGPLTPLVVPPYPYHEITKDFRVATAFHTARSVSAGTAAVEGVSAQNLVETSQASWAETTLPLKEPIEMDEGTDKQGPVALGAVATLRVEASPSPAPSPEATAANGASPSPSPSPSPDPEEEPAARPEGRVVAIGDSDFASNALLGFQGNEDFFLNVVAWLAQDTDLIAIRPKEPEDQRLFLTRTQQQNVTLLALVVMPGLFIVLGIAAWWRRRS